MKGANKRRLIIAAILVVGVAMAYMWQYNLGPFRGGAVAGVRNGHIRVDHGFDHFRMDHVNLLLPYRGGVSYNFYGQGVMVYIAYFERDELVLHERVGGISTGEPYRFSGSMIWGVTTEDTARRELRARVGMNGAVGFGYFDFSQIDFEPASTISAPLSIADGPIEPGRRYPLHIWQTGGSWWVDRDVFLPERLRENEKTIILYIVFE